MNKKILSFAVLAFLVTSIISCKGKNKEGEEKTNSEQSTSPDNPKAAEENKASGPANEPKTYTLSFAPDSLYLGKAKEAFIKVLAGEAVELQDPDGKEQGLNVKIKMRCTNKSTLDNKVYFTVSPGDSRMELVNGTSLTYKGGDGLNPEAEASEEAEWEFEVPAGAKPAKLNLFLDGTRVAVTLSLADKKK
jgi:hypothetical protein